MAFPPELSAARLRASWIRADGSVSPGILTIRSKYFTGVGSTIVTPAPIEVRLTDGKLDVAIPIGDDPDLSSPIQLEITARINGVPPQTWTVQVTASDVQTVDENGQSVKVVNLHKLLVIDGIPLLNLGLVRSVNGVKPDASGNVTVPAGITQAALNQTLQGYATGVDLAARPTVDQVTRQLTAALANYTTTAALGRLIRDQVAAMVVAGPGIQVSYDPQAGLLIVTNSGGGTTTTPAGAFQSTFTTTL